MASSQRCSGILLSRMKLALLVVITVSLSVTLLLDGCWASTRTPMLGLTVPGYREPWIDAIAGDLNILDGKAIYESSRYDLLTSRINGLQSRLDDNRTQGSNQYRIWYTSTDDSILDHGDPGTNGTIENYSLADVARYLGTSTSYGRIVLQANKTYEFRSPFAFPPYVTLDPQPGAFIKPSYSARNSRYRWTKYGATNEYYLELAAGGDPGVGRPTAVYQNTVAMTEEATPGALAAGQWAWGTSPGAFWTIYVRLADSTDPDTKAEGWVTAGVTVTFDRQSQTGPHRTQLFDLSSGGQIAYSHPGVIFHEHFGSDWAGFVAAFGAAPSGSKVSTSASAMTAVSTLTLDKMVNLQTLNSSGLTVTSSPALSGLDMIHLKTGTYALAHMKWTDGMILKSNGYAKYGLHVQSSFGCTYDNIQAEDFPSNGAGVYFDGNDTGIPCVSPFVGHPCSYVWANSLHNYRGTVKISSAGNRGAFGSFQFFNSTFSDPGGSPYGLYATAPSGEGYTIELHGGNIEGNSIYGLYVDQPITVTLDGTHEESNTIGSVHLSGGAVLNLMGGSSITLLTNNDYTLTNIDGNSTVNDYGGNYVDARYTTPSVLGGRRTAGFHPVCWGPPNWNMSQVCLRSGYSDQTGSEYVDYYGTHWYNYSAQGNTPRLGMWIPKDGVVIIPFNYNDFGDVAGISTLTSSWFPEQYMMLDRIDVFISDNFTCTGGSGQFIRFSSRNMGGQPDKPDRWISSTQGAIANLKAGTLISSWDNDATNHEPGLFQSGKGVLLKPCKTSGSGFDATFYDPTCLDYIQFERWAGGGTFTAGAGYAVLHVRPVKGIR